MAERYEDRYRGEEYRSERGYGRDREDRGFFERAGDEVRSWFGDDEAERRRRFEERERERQPERWSEPYRAEQGRGSERWGGENRGESGYGTRYTGGYADPYGGSSRYGSTGSTRSFAERQRTSWEAGRRGQFVGRGPKGYERSDARINEDVCDRLTDAPDIDATDIEVRVVGGEVTLSGTVLDRDDKRRVEDLIENISGVREVHNHLRVSRGTGVTGTSTSVQGSATKR